MTFCPTPQIELMVHRRLLQDDNLGVMEPLNETDVGCSPYPTQVPGLELFFKGV